MSPLRIALAFGCAAIALAPCAARADVSTDDPAHLHLYHDAHLGPVSPEARRAVAKVVSSCVYSPMSRIGPSPRDRARCDQATAEATKLGSDGARASLAALERRDVPPTARMHLYEVVGQSGDTALAEPLAKALDRVSPQVFMFDESWAIENGLRRLTFADVGEHAPWHVPAGEQTPRAHADGWRRFVEQHRGKSHEELRAERMASARAEKADADAERAYLAADFLVGQPDGVEEGRQALAALLTRDDLPRGADRAVKNLLGASAPRQAQQAARSRS